ncbi:MAG: S8 family serine peptidase [Clostridia bacterium]|nr:S8 family serine peptidase [Clostridia bacterium]
MKSFNKIICVLMTLCVVFSALGVSAVTGSAASSDPFASMQWDMDMIGMDTARESGLTGKGVRVAIIDSGVSTNTKDIDSDRLLAGKNMIEPLQDTQDYDGHGTFIAGIIGASVGNGVGIAGMAPGVTIVPIKTTVTGTSLASRNAEAVMEAVDEFGCDVINLSFGSKKSMQTLHDAIKYAVSKGVIVVCSTGNDGTQDYYYPGAYEETIGVGAVEKTKEASSFSHRNDSIFVTAPGNNTVSLSLVPGVIRYGSGTSVSAPYICGLAALLKERYPQMNKDDFAEILKASSEDLGEKGYDTTYGWGLVQVPQAIRAADLYFGSSDPFDPGQQTPEKPSFWDRVKAFFANSWLGRLFRFVFGR